jgi:hypothetical protein
MRTGKHDERINRRRWPRLEGPSPPSAALYGRRRRWRLRWPRLLHGDAADEVSTHVRLSPICLGLDLKKSPGFLSGRGLDSVRPLKSPVSPSVATPERCIWFHALPDLWVGILSER